MSFNMYTTAAVEGARVVSRYLQRIMREHHTSFLECEIIEWSRPVYAHSGTVHAVANALGEIRPKGSKR
jgi:hypothetical protein